MAKILTRWRRHATPRHCLSKALDTIGIRRVAKLTIQHLMSSLMHETQMVTVANDLGQRLQRFYRKETWPLRMRVSIAAVILDLARTRLEPELFEMIPDGSQSHPRGQRFVLVPTEFGREWLEKLAAAHQLKRASWDPSGHPPRDWKHGDTRIIVRRSSVVGVETLNATNTLQRTPWRFNERVAAVLREAFHSGSTIGGLPKPDFPQAYGYSYNARRYKWVAKRRRVAAALSLLKTQPNPLYYKWYIDFRGRHYARGTYITPQGNDLGRSLLLFDNGKPIGGAGDRLALHGANMWGLSKSSEEARIAWVASRSQDITQVSADPFTATWWSDAVDPWRFLAFCFEWADYLRDGPNHVTHLPCQIDGTCNGFQITALLTRDAELAKWVGLVPTETPKDLYSEVARLVNQMLRKSVSPRGEVWLKAFNGEVPREAVKPLLIGLCNGASVHRPADLGRWMWRHGFFVPGESRPERRDHGQWFAHLVHKALCETVPSWNRMPTWFRGRGRVKWESPVGVTIDNVSYRQVQYMVMNRLSMLEPTDVISSAVTGRSLLPNYINSMDAAGMVKTVNRCDFDIVTIHDCFAALAPNMDALHRAVRESYVEVFTVDQLADFAKQVNINTQTSPIPHANTFNVEDMLHAKYCFT